MENEIIRISTVICFVSVSCYWYITEKITEKNKPKNKGEFSILKFFQKHVFLLLELLILAQILGYKILPIKELSILFSFIGLLLTIGGLVICLWARKILGDNWTNAYEYQIKNRHELITEGIYSLIRHPIYLGLTLMLIGGELVAGSYLFIFFFAFFVLFYFQGKREEKILLAHFGKEYKDYIYRTKMLIPYFL